MPTNPNEFISLLQMVAMILAFVFGMGALLGIAAALIEGVIALNEWHTNWMYRRRTARRYVNARKPINPAKRRCKS